MKRFWKGEALSAAFLCCVWTLASATSLFGQAATASISGRVTDSSGAAVPAVPVTVTNTGTSATQVVTTDAQGRYLVPDLAIGTYNLSASKEGFQTAVRNGVVLTVGSAPVVDFQLAVGQANQTVNVEAQVSQVETTNSAVSSLVNQTQMTQLPLNGRDFEQLILLAPGVSTYPAGGSSALTSVANAYSISGTRPEGYANMLDGEDMLNWWQRNAGANVTGTSLGIEAIAEFQTLTGTYGAQYAGNGGAINAVSKSGTNTFHGSAYEFLRNSDLDSRGFFDAGSPPPFRRNQFGASLGGPIKKDKLFFFANYEGIRQVLDTTYVNDVPSASVHQGYVGGFGGTQYPINPASAAMLNLYPLPNGASISPDVGIYNYVGSQTSPENFGIVRLDYNVSTKDSLFGRYQIDFGTRTTYAGLGLWPTDDVTHNQFLTVGERHIFSPTVVNQFYMSYSRPVTSEVQPAEHSALQIFQPAREDVFVALPNGYAALGASFINPFRYLENKFTPRDDLTWIKGSHTISTGIWVKRDQLNPYAYTYWNGFYLFLSMPDFFQGNPFEFTGAPNGGTDAYRAERMIMVEPYIQDDWKVNSRLTINLGLRYEFETNPVEIHNAFYNVVGPPFGSQFQNVPNAYVSNPSVHNLDPRVGLAWDIFGDHKTSFRAGFGIFHDPFTTYTFSSAYTSNPPYLTENQFFPNGDPNWPVPLVGSVTPLLSQTNGTYYGTHQTPYSLEYTATLQHQLPGNTLLSVGYTGTRGVHLLAFHDFNAPVPTVINGVDHFAINGVQNPRPDPNFGALDMTDTTSYSSYNAMLVSVQHRLSANLVGQFSYTYSHCIDSAYTYGGLGFNNATSAITNPYNWAADRGNCSYDLRHVISGNFVYLLPFKGNRLKEGWQFSLIQAWHTGVPFSLSEGDQADLQNNFDSERPNYVAGCNPYANQTVHQWYNPACFTASAYGTIGNLGRNNLWGPGYLDTDIAVVKNTKLNERISLQFRADLFNLFNQPNFAVPNTTIFNAGVTPTLSSTAGQITSLVGSGGLSGVARQTQFSLKLVF
ncbi:MAG TPA: carboxypeptidase regulatory-like domain-containing protein [Bryobacteraceae bacterium]|nr:carboxypeptidase regulatory-like domain-containing protein [Bryobacteraceae bacterium]